MTTGCRDDLGEPGTCSRSRRTSRRASLIAPCYGERMVPGSDPIPPLTLTWNDDVYTVDRLEYERLGLIELDDVLLRGTIVGDTLTDLVVVETVKAVKA